MTNAEGYKDPTADTAVDRCGRDKEIKMIIHIYRCIAALAGMELCGRVVFKDKRTGARYE